MTFSCATTDRRYSIVRNNAGRQLCFSDLPEPLRGLEDRLSRLPRLGNDPEERPLPWVLPEKVLRFEATQLFGCLIFYNWGEEAVAWFFIVWGREARSKGRVGRSLVAV